DSDGLVTAVGVGKANLKVRADNGRLNEVKTVRVYKPVDVTALSITSEDGFVMLGETQQFYADVTPSNADNPAVTWHTTDSDVFTIDDNGVLTPVGVGKANVKVRWAEDDSVQAIKTVRITAPVPVTALSVTSEDGFVMLGETQQFYADVTPSNATNPAVTWHTTNPDVFTVDDNGVLTPVSVGKANVKARWAENDLMQAIKTVRITAPVPVNGLTVSSEDGIVLLGETQQFFANILPTNATNQSVTWHTTDRNVFTVDANGVLTPVGVGKANVKVRWAEDSNMAATMTVRVR
ncbi:Ig-like domain-containing protein, partial [bacterium]|nr:Ig-like domain-containing protein [bacterium]